MILALLHPVWAADTDLSVTSLGTQAFHAQTIGAQSVDFLVGQRLRWGIAENTRALIDGRMLVDPTAALSFEETRLRELGVSYESRGLSVTLGRSTVMYGARRLVDGLQLVGHAGARSQWSFGGWVGLVPDEFTTAPTTRVGVGPIFDYTRSAGSISLVGDLVMGAGGLQRLASLAQGRYEIGQRVQTGGRLDWVFDDGTGRQGVADGAADLLFEPTDALQLGALYNAYSTLFYRSRASLDPRVQRFAARIESLGLTEGITQDEIDPTLHHVVGADARLTGQGAVRPSLWLSGRLQQHADPAERYSRISARTGLGGLASDKLELALGGSLLGIDGQSGGDAGIFVLIEPFDEAIAAVDGSFLLLFDPIDFRGKPGLYADLFFDIASLSGAALSAGGSWTAEPADIVGIDIGLAAFLRVQQWIRPGRAPRHNSQAAAEPDPTQELP